MNVRGKLVVITGPSGVGKSTIVRQALERTGAQFSVSATTRQPRAGETDGREYRFVDTATFEAMIERGELLEWAKVYGQYYGTPAADVLAAIDFTTIEVWTKGGLVTYYLLFVMEIATRRVHFAGCTPNPTELWMKQIARNLTDAEDGFLNGKRYILMDRDGKFCPAFREILKNEGVEPVLLPPKSPNLNAHLERFHKSLKDECLDRMIFFGETMLRNATREYLLHYHKERNHQGLDNQLIDPDEELGQSQGEVQCRERIGGLLQYYYRDAA